MFLEILQGLISGIVLYCFLTVLFVLSLWHNYATVHFRNEPDPRDIRKSHTTIHSKTSTDGKKHRHHKHSNSISSSVPLNIVEDDINNIEYDHTITNISASSPNAVKKGQANMVGSSNNNDDSTGVNAQSLHNVQDNPFHDVLSLEDTRLVADLKFYYNQYGIEIEEFEVETDDGFIIDLWHLKKKENSDPLQPILMIHGLLQSSGAFASTGRKSLTYYLHENGFDIWLGNNRCGLKAKWNMKKIGTDKRKKWDWDINEMVQYDVKALVETVLNKTNYEKLTLVAHSQGTTQGFMGLINGEKLYDDGFKLIDKLENYVALAPAIYPGPLLHEKSFVRFMASGIDSPWVFGTKSFIPLMMQMRSLAVGTKAFSFFSYIMFNYLFDWNDALWDRILRDRNFLFSPVNISVKLMQWWLSPDPSKLSFKYGADRIFPHDKTWFPIKESTSNTQTPSANKGDNDTNSIDNAKIQKNNEINIHLNKMRNDATDYPRLLLFIPKQDRLVDGEKLINHFIDKEDNSVYKIWYIDEYSHLDVLWAHDVIERIGKPIIAHIRHPKLETE